MQALRACVVGGHVLAAAGRMGVRLAAGALAPGRESRASVLGRTLEELFRALGPAYVKLGQLLSTRRDLLCEDAVRHLARLRDRLPPGPWSAVPAAFAAELRVRVDQVFAELEPSPVASASIATVYRGRLRDGRVVAVKVKRPDAARRIGTDLRLLRRAGRLLGRLPGLRLVPVAAAVEEFCLCLERQLDFGREAAASRRLRRSLGWEPGVMVPVLIEELCSPSILTMEFVAGADSPPAPGSAAARTALRSALRALYRMIFVEGCVHCDLHGGNLRFLRDGRAALLDFGFVVDLDDSTRLKFAEFFYALATNDGARCAQIAHDMALSVPPDFAYDAFAAEVAGLVGRASRASAGEFQVAGFVGGLFDLQRRYRLRATGAFVMPIVSLLVLEGIIKDVCPELDFQREAQPFLLRASIRPYTPRPGERTNVEIAKDFFSGVAAGHPPGPLPGS